MGRSNVIGSKLLLKGCWSFTPTIWDEDTEQIQGEGGDATSRCPGEGARKRVAPFQWSSPDTVCVFSLPGTHAERCA